MFKNHTHLFVGAVLVFVSLFVGAQMVQPARSLAAQTVGAKNTKAATISSQAISTKEVAGQKNADQDVALGVPYMQYDFRSPDVFNTDYTDKKRADDAQFAGPIMAVGVTVDVEAPIGHTSATLNVSVYSWDSYGYPDTPNREGELFTGSMQVTESGAYTFDLDNVVFPRRVFIIANVTADDSDPSLMWSLKFNQGGSPSIGHTEAGGWYENDEWSRTNTNDMSASVRGFLLGLQNQCVGDANENRRVDSADMSVLSSQFGSEVFPYAGSDFNGDGKVDGRDLSVLLPNFGNSCAPSSVYVVPTEAPSLSNCRSQPADGPVNVCNINMPFTVANTGSEDILISKIPAIALSTTTSVNGVDMAVASTSLRTVTVSGIPGDSSASYRVPANSTRAFLYAGRFGRPAGLEPEMFALTALKFGTTDVNGVADTSFNSQTLTPYTNAESLANLNVDYFRLSY